MKIGVSKHAELYPQQRNSKYLSYHKRHTKEAEKDEARNRSTVIILVKKEKK